MSKDGKDISYNVTKYAFVFLAAWTLVIIGFIASIVIYEMAHARQLARNDARTHFNKDQAFRLWGSSHGGVYVPPTDHTPPSPYLLHIPDRDIELASGKKLTLMNPAYMIRQLMEDYDELYGVKGRITSLNPLRPQNAPDPWERSALESFQKSRTEADEFVEVNGQRYLRFMQPMITQQSCLKCHGHQGYKVGDIRGGVGVSVPVQPYFEQARLDIIQHSAVMASVWLLGIAVTTCCTRNIRRRQRERAEAEQTLEKERQRLAKAQEIGQIGTWELDLAENALTWTDQNHNIFGIPEKGELTYETFLECVHPKDRDCVNAEWTAALEGKPYDIEHRIIAGGTVKWVREKAELVRDKNGKTIRAIGFTQDITERKQIAKKMEIRSRVSGIFAIVSNDNMYGEVLSVILEAMESQYGVFGYIDEDGSLVVPSMTTHIWDKCKITDKRMAFPSNEWGCSSWPEAIRQKKCFCSNQPSTNVPRGHVSIQRHISMPIIYRDEVVGLLQIANKPSAYTPEDVEILEEIADMVSPILYERLQRDFQEKNRIKAEQAVREKEEEFRSTLDNLQIGVVVHASDTRILFSNPHASTILGLSRDQMLGKKVIDPAWCFVHEDGTAMAVADYPVNKVLSSKQPLVDYIVGIRRPDTDDITYAIVSAIPRFDKKGEVERVVVNFVDITERKQAEAEREMLLRTLESKNKELQSVVYIASHDLKSPLVNIKGFSGMLEECCSNLSKMVNHSESIGDEQHRKELERITSDEIPQCLKFIRAGASKMNKLLDGLLQVSRAGTREVIIKPLNMNKIINDIQEAAEFQIEKTETQIAADDLPGCMADEEMINEIFSNLIGNAIKYRDPNRPGRIHLSGWTEDGISTYCVEDNGIGIAENHIDKIFEIFHRLNPTKDTEGEGLGLSIVTRSLDRLNGTIRVESELGTGSKFFVTLPAC